MNYIAELERMPDHRLVRYAGDRIAGNSISATRDVNRRECLSSKKYDHIYFSGSCADNAGRTGIKSAVAGQDLKGESC